VIGVAVSSKQMAGRVLVTGANGLIGAQTAATLASAGLEVIRAARGHQKDDVAALAVDLSDPRALDVLSQLPPISAVAHCAAMIPLSFAGVDAERAAGTNRRIDSSIIEFCCQRDARLVYCSSVAVYRDVASQVVSEAFPAVASGPYADEKLWAEARIREQLRSHAILRICAPYGPAQRSRTVLKIFIEQAIAGGELKYFGSGSRQQDFLHARDAAGAVLRAVERPQAHGVFNVCSGQPISMRELAQLVANLAGNARARVVPSGQPDPQEDYRARFDTARAAEMLDWHPVVTLAEGVREMVDRAGETS
jgi:nucleoside-diphosphate-sugar epimerase